MKRRIIGLIAVVSLFAALPVPQLCLAQGSPSDLLVTHHGPEGENTGRIRTSGYDGDLEVRTGAVRSRG